jgi:hypothetical protein
MKDYRYSRLLLSTGIEPLTRDNRITLVYTDQKIDLGPFSGLQIRVVR